MGEGYDGEEAVRKWTEDCAADFAELEAHRAEEDLAELLLLASVMRKLLAKEATYVEVFEDSVTIDGRATRLTPDEVAAVERARVGVSEPDPMADALDLIRQAREGDGVVDGAALAKLLGIEEIEDS